MAEGADVGAALVAGVAELADCAGWGVHAVDKIAVASSAATADRIVTAKASALRKSFGPSNHVDRRNVSPIGNLIPEIARAVAGVLAGVANGLTHDSDPGAV